MSYPAGRMPMKESLHPSDEVRSHPLPPASPPPAEGQQDQRFGSLHESWTMPSRAEALSLEEREPPTATTDNSLMTGTTAAAAISFNSFTAGSTTTAGDAAAVAETGAALDSFAYVSFASTPKTGEKKSPDLDDAMTPSTATAWTAAAASSSFCLPGSVRVWYFQPGKVYSGTQKQLILVYCCLVAGVGVLSATLFAPAMYLAQRDLDTTTNEIQMTFSLFLAASALSPVFLGFVGDVWGWKALLLLSHIVGAASSFALYVSTSIELLIVFRAFQGIYCALVGIAASGIVADIFDESRHGRVLGWVLLGISLGPALGPVLGGVISQYSADTWHAVFLTSAIAATAFGAVGLALAETAPAVLQYYCRDLLLTDVESQCQSNSNGQEGSSPPSHQSVRRNVSIMRTILSPTRVLLSKLFFVYGLPSAFLFGAYLYLISVFSKVFGRDFGYDVITTGLLFLPSGGGMLLGSRASGLAIDRVGAKLVCCVMTPLGGVAMCLLHIVLDRSLAANLVLSFLTCVCVSSSQNAAQIILVQGFREVKSAALSANRFGFYAWGFVCVQAGAAMESNWGLSIPEVVLIIGITGIVISLPLFAAVWEELLALRRKRKEERGRDQRSREE